MVIDSSMLYSMLTSPDEGDVNIGMSISRYYKGSDDKLNRLINFYKILRQQTFLDGMTFYRYPLTLNLKEHYLDLSSNNKLSHLDLPDNLIIGSLDLTNCKGLKKLPNNLNVSNLHIQNTKINEIPKGLIVDRLYFKTTPLYLKYKNISEVKKDIIDKGGDINKYWFTTDLINIKDE